MTAVVSDEPTRDEGWPEGPRTPLLDHHDAVRVEAHFAIQRVLREWGYRPGIARLLPEVGSDEWWDADDLTKVAALLPGAERWLDVDVDVDRLVANRIKHAALDVWEAGHHIAEHKKPGVRPGSELSSWQALASPEHLRHEDVERHRRSAGPIHHFDRAAVARWVETGDSKVVEA